MVNESITFYIIILFYITVNVSSTRYSGQVPSKYELYIYIYIYIYEWASEREVVERMCNKENCVHI